MFLQVSVCPRGDGRCLPQCMLGYTPRTRGRHPAGADTTSVADTPSGTEPPPREQTPSCAVHAGRYGQQAGGTHPTGMHTCSRYCVDQIISEGGGGNIQFCKDGKKPFWGAPHSLADPGFPGAANPKGGRQPIILPHFPKNSRK